MAQNRFYSSSALPTFLTSGVGASGNPQVASVTGLPTSFPFTMLIDWGLSTQEAISVTSAPTGVGPFTLPCTRGIDGTTAQSHGQNAVVVHGTTEQDYSEPQVHINAAGPQTDPESGNTIAVHGIANGSAVVGTIDTQTLTNKTFTGVTVSGGAATITNNDAVGPVLTVTNQHSTPTNSALRIVANAAADAAESIRVSGDSVNRFQLDSNGKIQWGPGGSTTPDTDLYRNAVGEVKTDNSLTAAGNVTVGGVLATAGASGVLVVNNATTLPTSTPVASFIGYGNNGYFKWRGGDGADYQTGSNISFVAAAGVNVTGTTANTITGLSALLGTGTYLVNLNLSYLPTGTIGSTTTFNFAFTGTASTTALNWQILQQGAANAVTMAGGSLSTIAGNMLSPTHVANGAGLTVTGILIVSVAGTLTVTATDQVSADTITVNGGSFLELQPIA